MKTAWERVRRQPAHASRKRSQDFPQELMFHLAGQIFFGLIVGTLAKLVMPGRDPAGVIVTALVGLAGSAAGALVGHDLFGAQCHLADWIVSALGAIAALVIYWLATRARRDYGQNIFRQR